MYHRYFGMKHRPFTANAQGSYYPAAIQEEALATLQYAITQGRGIALLTGLPGTGKTLVCQRLTVNLEPSFTTAMITNTHMPTVKGLLQAILYDLSLPFHGLDEQELRLTLTDFLLGKYAGGGRMVLVIDEAHNLAVPLLEELRMLSNLEGESDKLFQIVLVGHPRLLPLLRTPELETLSQRVGARATLTPLSDEETVAFIQYQIESAGVPWDRVFTYEAMCAVHQQTNGIPRLIIQLADHALLRAYVTESRRVDRSIVIDAKADLDQPTELRRGESAMPRIARVSEFEMETDDLIPDAEPECESADTFVACTEYQGCQETLQICTDTIGQEVVPALSKPVADGIRSDRSCCSPTSNAFQDEELVIDPYAMMDAARSTSTAQRPCVAVAKQANTIGADRATRDRKAPVATPVELPSTSTGATPGIAETHAHDALFVEPTDAAAIHEVGAGVNGPTHETEPPILVIENRQQRVGGQIARMDTPQPTSRESRGYRRLFSHARKS